MNPPTSRIGSRFSFDPFNVFLRMLLAFGAVAFYLSRVETSLDHFVDFQLGIATLEGVSIAKRISHYYWMVIIYSGVFFLSYFLIPARIFSRVSLAMSSPVSHAFERLLNIRWKLVFVFSAILHCILNLIFVFTRSRAEPLPLDFSFTFLGYSFLAGLILAILARRASFVQKLESSSLVVSTMIALSCSLGSFGIKNFYYQFLSIAGLYACFRFSTRFEKNWKQNLLHFFWVSFSVGLSAKIYVIQWTAFEMSPAFNVIALILLVIGSITLLNLMNGHQPRFLKAMAISPLLMIVPQVAYELSYTFQAHQIHALSVNQFSFIVLLMLLSWMVFRFFSGAPNSGEKSTGVLAFSFTLSLLLLVFHRTEMPFSGEMFENANYVLPLHGWFHFDEFPIVQSMNSHLWSDFFWGTIHSLINGYQGLSQLSYDFLYRVLHYLVAFVFFFRFFKDHRIFAFGILIFPFFDLFIPAHHVYLGLAPLVCLSFYLNKKTFLTRSLLIGSLVFLGVFKADIGLAASIGMAAVLGIGLFLRIIERKELLKIFLTSVFIAAIPLGVYAYWCLHQGLDILEPVALYKSYFSSAQSYGYQKIGDNSAIGRWHYVVFPCLFATILIAVVVRMKALVVRCRDNIFPLFCLVFLICYYFFNAPRGLIRHGLIEQFDMFISVFAYLMFAIGTYLVCQIKGRKVSASVAIATLAALVPIWFLSVPSKFQKFNRLPIYAIQRGVFSEAIGDTATSPRVGIDPRTKNSFSKLYEFMDLNLQPSETFYEFTNTPMLYYFFDRRVPGMSTHPTLSNHSLLLQENLIFDLETSQVPLVIYSYTQDPRIGNIDHVPTVVRHQKIASYIHRNYRPMGAIDGRCIWSRHGWEPEKEVDFAGCPRLAFRVELKNLPSYLANFEIGKNLLSQPENRSGRKQDWDYVLVELTNPPLKNGDAIFSFGAFSRAVGSFSFALKKNQLRYVFPVGAHYRWVSNRIDSSTVYQGGGDGEEELEVKAISPLRLIQKSQKYKLSNIR